MTDSPRDLAHHDLWANSLARSFARRGRDAARAKALVLPRDLSESDWWEQSAWRSQRRREARDNDFAFGGSAARRLAIPTAMLATGVTGAGALAPAMLATAQAAKVVKRGDSGGSVQHLQRALGLQADGIFGPGTKRALKRFQRRHGLTADGVAGPATWAALRGASASRAAGRDAAHGGLRGGESSSSHVRTLQRLLGINADGVYGPSTDQAVRRFQARVGLAPDGVVGPATWAALQRRSPARDRGASGGHATSRGGAVTRLQRALGIGADGVFGPQTARAVKAFQRAHGLTADGVVGPATWSALGVPGMTTIVRRGHAGAGGGPAGPPSAIAKGIAAANRIAGLPYRWGGGHGSFTDSGYDCSGSVSYVLHAMGKLSSPLDSSALMSYGRPGPGKYVTIYANSGHVYMTINGRRFDTSARYQTGSRWGKSGRSSSGYVVRHPAGL